MNLLGDVGGLMGICELFGSYLISSYASFSFVLKVVSSLYLARTKEVDLFKKKSDG